MSTITTVQIPNGNSAKSLKPRDRILFTAHKLFYRDGIRATGVDALIADASVTKTTFYRQFASKNELINEFLEHRHKLWMSWFEHKLKEYGDTPDAICPSLREWFSSEDFRGCAFINSLAELGDSQPEIVEIIKKHKQDLRDAVARLMPRATGRVKRAKAIAMAIDGAIIRAQIDRDEEQALATLQYMIQTVHPGDPR